MMANDADTLCVKRKKSTLVDVLHIQLRNMDNQKRENIRKGAAEILLQMIRVKNQEHTATAHRDRMMCHRKRGFAICFTTGVLDSSLSLSLQKEEAFARFIHLKLYG